MIKLFDPNRLYKNIAKQHRKRIIEVYNSGQYILGKEVRELEDKLSEYFNGAYCLTCASGTDALILALMALDIKEKDEVITSPFTFIATAESIKLVNATPVFADVNINTFNIEPKLIEKCISKKTKAIMPVHLFGQSADMESIVKIAKKYKLKIIEDCAQSFGAEYNNKKCGIIGDIGCFSFFPAKNLGSCGDGGFVVTKSKKLYEKMKALRIHGQTAAYVHKYIGLNARMDTIQAAIVIENLKYIDKWNSRRRENAGIYKDILKDVKQIILPYEDKKAYHTFNQFTIITDKRDKLKEHLMKNNIASAVYYPISLHKQEAMKRNRKPFKLKNSEYLSKKVLSIPIAPYLTKKEIKETANTIIEFYNKKL